MYVLSTVSISVISSWFSASDTEDDVPTIIKVIGYYPKKVPAMVAAIAYFACGLLHLIRLFAAKPISWWGLCLPLGASRASPSLLTEMPNSRSS
jgi:hypothetical protein